MLSCSIFQGGSNDTIKSKHFCQDYSAIFDNLYNGFRSKSQNFVYANLEKISLGCCVELLRSF